MQVVMKPEYNHHKSVTWQLDAVAKFDSYMELGTPSMWGDTQQLLNVMWALTPTPPGKCFAFQGSINNFEFVPIIIKR